MLNVRVCKLRAGGAAASSLRIRVDAEIYPNGRNPMEFWNSPEKA